MKKNMKQSMFVIFLYLFSSVQAVDIFKVIEQGNKKEFKLWLKSKQNLMIVNHCGQSVLHVAVLSKNKKMIKSILKYDIDINHKDIYGKTAMDYAVENDYKNIVITLASYNALVASDENFIRVSKITKEHRKKNWMKVAIFLPLGLVSVGVLMCLGFIGFLVVSGFTVPIH